MDRLYKHVWPLLLGLMVFGMGGAGVRTLAQDLPRDNFWYLAQSFWEGKTYFTSLPFTKLGDTTEEGGNYYWPLGPGPAVWLMPWVGVAKTVGWEIPWGGVSLSLLAPTMFLAWWIARRAGYGRTDSGYLVAALVTGSVFLEVAFTMWTWRLAHGLTVMLSLLAIAEYMSRRRYWVMGILMAAVLTTRMTAGLSVVFFGLMLWWERSMGWREKLGKLIQLGAAVAAVVVALAGYNYARFGNFADTGYMRAILLYRWERDNRGLFKLGNIPTNFYYYFIKGVDPVWEIPGVSYYLKWPYVKAGYPGVGFFVVAPVFLYVFRTDIKRKEVRAAILTAGIIIGVLLTYYWVGWTQAGPRYMNDALPWLYVLLVSAFTKKRLPGMAKVMILFSSYTNLFLIVGLQ